jgi:uncharacterized protein involved in exopolysaccharide biosynthesis
MNTIIAEQNILRSSVDQLVSKIASLEKQSCGCTNTGSADVESIVVAHVEALKAFLESRLAQVEQKAESSIAALSARVDALEGRLASVEGRVSECDSRDTIICPSGLTKSAALNGLVVKVIEDAKHAAEADA